MTDGANSKCITILEEQGDYTIEPEMIIIQTINNDAICNTAIKSIKIVNQIVVMTFKMSFCLHSMRSCLALHCIAPFVSSNFCLLWWNFNFFRSYFLCDKRMPTKENNNKWCAEVRTYSHLNANFYRIWYAIRETSPKTSLQFLNIGLCMLRCPYWISIERCDTLLMLWSHPCTTF